MRITLEIHQYLGRKSPPAAEILSLFIWQCDMYMFEANLVCLPEISYHMLLIKNLIPVKPVRISQYLSVCASTGIKTYKLILVHILFLFILL